MKSERRRSRARLRTLTILEALEERALLATTSFQAPNLTPYVRLAFAGKNTGGAAISTMTRSLQDQLASGPLADLNAGVVDSGGFVAGAQALEQGYEQSAVRQLGRWFPKLDEMIALQGRRVVSDLLALNQELSVGLITDAEFANLAGASIQTLTGGPIQALHTSTLALASRTQVFESTVTTIAASLDPGSDVPLSSAAVTTTLIAEAEAYRSAIFSAVLATNARVASAVDTAVTRFEVAISSLDATDPAVARIQVGNALSVFDTAILDTTGLFGAHGPVFRAVGPRSLPPTHRHLPRAVSAITAVSGTASNGLATLTATLTTGYGRGLAGQPLVFSIDGAFAGTGFTDANGVATLAGVGTTAPLGTNPGAIVVTFAGDPSTRPSTGVGDLTVVETTALLGNVSGSAAFGGQATLTASLTVAGTNEPIVGALIAFTLDGSPVGSALTNASGVATLTGVASSASAGTSAGAVGASFTGDDAHGPAAPVSGNLVVSPAATTLGGVSGTAIQGGTATLTATLTSNVTGQGIAGQTVAFTLQGTAVGTALTNASGVATLSGVPTGLGQGTFPNAVGVGYAGGTNFAAAPTALGNLVVTQTSTILSAVSGTAVYGGSATLSATLRAASDGSPVVGAAVVFTLSGIPIGSAITNASGVATLTGAPSDESAGTHVGAVVASFLGNPSFGPAPEVSGDLVVSKASSLLSGVYGSAEYGGTATLTASLESPAGTPLAGATIDFTLDGVPIGSAVTDVNGVANLTGVAITDPVGTYPDVVVASFAGDANHDGAADVSGDLVVSQADTALSAVSGSGAAGGTGTLTATLRTSGGAPIQGAIVSFTLNGAAVGTALTDASGVATLSGVTMTDPAGTYPDVIVASFAGDANFNAAADASGDLVVNAIATVLSGVSGSAEYGGTGVFLALLETSGGTPIQGATVVFTLNGTVVGSAQTDTSGIAMLSGVPITDPAGTYSGVIVASFVGDGTHDPALDASGDLLVASANTILRTVSSWNNENGTLGLSAELISTVTSAPVSGVLLEFFVFDVSFGTALTIFDGFAYLTIPNVYASGTHPGAVRVEFAGNSNYNGTSATGDLVV